ncbi:hypothetical protein [Marinobacter sp.]|uniref:hypothetical protein n=1 Tax=Marinobacter sp. TaxID=50741 RepID=UPI00384D6C3E
MNIIQRLGQIMLFGMLMVALPLQAEKLTDLQIESFIASMEELQEKEADFEAAAPDMENGDPASLPSMDTLISDNIKRMKGHVLYDQVDTIVQQHGFEGVEHWGKMGDRILNAYVAANMGAESREVRNEMAETLREIENSPDLTPPQKEQMKNMLGGAVSSLEQMVTAPQEDIEAIKPHMGALHRVLETEENGKRGQ